MATASEILRNAQAAGVPVPERVEAAFDSTMPGITEQIFQRNILDTLGADAPLWVTRQMERPKKIELPSVSAVLAKLDIASDPEDMPEGRTAIEKFLAGMGDPKKRKDWKETIEGDENFGKRGWDFVRNEMFPAVAHDKMLEDTQKAREAALSGDGVDGLGGLAQTVGGYAMKFFRPRVYEALTAGREPSWKDQAGDIIETGLMSVPATGYVGGAARALGKIPKVGALASRVLANPKVANLLGNAAAPTMSEVVDASMRGEDDPNVERQDVSLGDAALGTATNLGVNFVLYPRLAQMGRGLMQQLSRSSGGGESASLAAREAIEHFGSSRAERGLGPATPEFISRRLPRFSAVVADPALDIAGRAAPTLLVNRYGGERDADVFLNMAGGIGGPAVKDVVKGIRDTERGEMQKRAKVADIVGVETANRETLSERDQRYLDAIKKNPDIVQFGYAADPEDFKLWLIERGHDLLRGTRLHRPFWTVGEKGKK